MAHFAKIIPHPTEAGKGIVVQVISVTDDNAPTEAAGLDFLRKLYGPGIIWKQTSYNTHGGVHTEGKTPLRMNYAGIGYIYDAGRDAFIPPKPYPSWVLNETKGIYDPPISAPTDGKRYGWDETNTTWKVQP